MKTPFGRECRYYYADYFRGQERTECRLLAQNRASERWQPSLCETCSVPDILQANACPHLMLEGRVEKRFLGLKRQVAVRSFCSRSLRSDFDPYTGCGHCHSAWEGGEQR